MLCRANKPRGFSSLRRFSSRPTLCNQASSTTGQEDTLPRRKLLLDLPNKVAQDDHWYKVKASRPSKEKREVWDKSRRETVRELFGETLKPDLPKEIHELVEAADEIEAIRSDVDSRQVSQLSASNEQEEVRYNVPVQPFDTFEKCFIRKPVVDALSKAYPHIKHPNLIQSKILPILADNNTDVIVKAFTGTGKSFALALYLFNKQRSITTSNGKTKKMNTPSWTSLVLVPGPELSMQYEGWIIDLLGSEMSPYSIVQTLYRTSDSQETEQLERLKHFPNPHIIIATPTRLLDIMQSNPDLLDWNALKILAIDEADQMLEPLKRGTTPKQAAKREKHPPPTQILVEFILSRRTNRVSPSGNYSSQELGRFTRAGGLRLIMVSATANAQLRHLVEKLLWVNRREKLRTIGYDDPQTHSVDILPSEASSTARSGELSSNPPPSMSFVKRTPASISHHVLKLIRKGKECKLTDAALPSHLQAELSTIKPASSASAISAAVDGAVTKQLESSLLLETYRNQSRPVNREWITALKAIIEHDDIKNAIVFIQHTVSRKKFVEAANLGGLPYVSELRFPLPPVSTQNGKDGRRIWVSQPLMTRGIDIPLSHVIIFNAPEDSTRYIHMAGRTGRHGAPGKCITILTWEEDQDPSLMNIERTLGERFSKIGVSVQPFFNTDDVTKEPTARKQLEWLHDDE